MNEDVGAARRAFDLGGQVTADELLPEVRWERDGEGAIVGYFKAVSPAAWGSHAQP
jgi:hypothetical protein